MAQSSAALQITTGQMKSQNSSCATFPRTRKPLWRAHKRALGFHRFNDALADIECAEQLFTRCETANGERAAIAKPSAVRQSLTLREP